MSVCCKLTLASAEYIPTGHDAISNNRFLLEINFKLQILIYTLYEWIVTLHYLVCVEMF